MPFFLQRATEFRAQIETILGFSFSNLSSNKELSLLKHINRLETQIYAVIVTILPSLQFLWDNEVFLLTPVLSATS